MSLSKIVLYGSVLPQSNFDKTVETPVDGLIEDSIDASLKTGILGVPGRSE